MSQSEGPNPERRSNNAMLCFCIGVGLMGLAWFMGVGGVMAAAFTGGNPAVVAGGLMSMVVLVLGGVCGFILALVGGVWMLVRVVADQTGDANERRYRNIER